MNDSTGDWDNTEEDNELDEYAELDVFNWDWFSFCMLNWPIILDSLSLLSLFNCVSLSFSGIKRWFGSLELLVLSDDIYNRDDLLFNLNESEEVLVELEDNEDDDDIGMKPKLDKDIDADEDEDGMNELDAPDIINLNSSTVPI